MMGRVRTAWLAWGTAVLSAGLAVAAVPLAAANGEGPAELVANHHAIGIVTAIGMAVLGALIASRKPRNPLGWLMSVAALLLGVYSFNQQYAPLAVAEALPCRSCRWPRWSCGSAAPGGWSASRSSGSPTGP